MLSRLLPAAILLCLMTGDALAQECRASWYGNEHHGRLTASGERFDQNALTAALRSRDFGQRIRVTNLDNGRSVVVRQTDYGPASWTGKCIDLSRGAAAALGMIRAGVAKVRIQVLN